MNNQIIKELESLLKNNGAMVKNNNMIPVIETIIKRIKTGEKTHVK